MSYILSDVSLSDYYVINQIWLLYLSSCTSPLHDINFFSILILLSAWDTFSQNLASTCDTAHTNTLLMSSVVSGSDITNQCLLQFDPLQCLLTSLSSFQPALPASSGNLLLASSDLILQHCRSMGFTQHQIATMSSLKTATIVLILDLEGTWQCQPM